MNQDTWSIVVDFLDVENKYILWTSSKIFHDIILRIQKRYIKQCNGTWLTVDPEDKVFRDRRGSCAIIYSDDPNEMYLQRTDDNELSYEINDCIDIRFGKRIVVNEEVPIDQRMIFVDYIDCLCSYWRGNVFHVNMFDFVKHNRDLSVDIKIYGSDNVAKITRPYMRDISFEHGSIGSIEIRCTRYGTYNESHFLIESDDFDYIIAIEPVIWRPSDPFKILCITEEIPCVLFP